MKKFYTQLLAFVAMTLLGTSAFAQVTGISVDDYNPCHNGNVTISWTEGGANTNVTIRVGTGTSPANTDLVNISSYPVLPGSNQVVVSGFVGGATYNIDIIGNQDATFDADAFTVDARPVKPTALDPAIDTVCTGATPTLDAIGGTDGTNGQLAWYQTDGSTLIGYGNPVSAAIVGTTNFKVRREDAVCGDNTPFVSLDMYVYANASAATDITLNGESNPIATPCPGTYTLGQTGANLTGVSPSTTVEFSVTAFTGPYVTSYNFPAGATTVYCRVTDGCSGTTYDYSEVVTMNDLSVDGTVTPDVSPFCTGSNITWTMNGATLGTGATYQYSLDGITWNPTLNAGTDNFWLINGVMATTTVYIRLVSACDTTAGASGIATAYVNPTDVSSVVTTPNQTTVCSGTGVTFTATGGSLGTNPGSYYEYSIDGGGFVNNGTNPAYAYVVNASTLFAWRIYDACTATSTTGSSVTMGVATNNTAPTAVMATDLNGGSICPGDIFDFQADGTLSNTTYNPLAYWEFASDAGFTTILEDSSLTGLYTGSIGAGLTVYARIAGGCGGTTASVNTNVTPVAASAAPSSIEVWDMAQATQYSANEEICAQTVTLVQVGGTADAGDGASYDFGTMDNGVFTLLANTGATSTYQVAHSIDTTYAVRLIGGCSGTSTPVTIAMGVAEDNATPDSMYVMDGSNWIANNAQLCSTAMLDYTIATTALGDNASYMFDVDVDGVVTPTNNGTNPTLSIDVASMGISSYMTVTGYVSGGCTDVSGTTFSHTVTVFSASSGFTAISLTNDEFCANSGVVATLKATGATVPGNANIVWYSLDNNTNAIIAKVKETSGATPGADSIMVAPTVTTTYGVRVEGCDTTVFEVRTVTVRDTSVAATGVSISPGTQVCPGMPVSYTATGGVAGFGAMAKWYSGATLIGSGNPLFITVNNDTNVTVRYEGFCNTTTSFAAASVTVYDSTDISVLGTGSACPNVSFDLNALVSPTGGSFTGTGASGHYFSYGTPGTYQLTYTKTFTGGCSFDRTVYVTVNAAPAFTLTLQSSPSGCNSNGSFLITGTPGDAFDVNSGDFTGTLDGAGEALITSTGGSYTVVVTGATMCSSSDDIIIPAAPGAVTATTDITDVACYGATNGVITVNASSGTSPYTYSLNGGTFGSSNVFENLAAGNYDVDVKDANGCIYSLNVDVEGVANALDLTVDEPGDVQCFGDNNGYITGLIASGGTAPYSFSVNGDDFTTETNYTNLSAGNYTITVKDANGCTADFSFTIEGPAQLVGSVSTVSYDVNTNTYTIKISANGGTGIKSFYLDNGLASTDSVFTGVAPGVHTWKVSDEHTCFTTGEFTLEDPSSVGVTTGAAELAVYPNPFASELTIAGTLPVNASIVMIDTYGKKVAVNMVVANGRTVINTDNLAKGMYILNINGEGVNVSRKVVKH